MKGYLWRHLAMEKYLEREAGGICYHHKNGWQDFFVGEGIVFSHRTNDYTEENFPEHLHSHDYCELLFWERGDVQYLCGDVSVTPKEGCVMFLGAGKSHTARLCAPSAYERFVLYCKPSAFELFGQRASDFEALFSEGEPFSFCLDAKGREEVRARLWRIEAVLTEGREGALVLAYAEIVLLLSFLLQERAAMTSVEAYGEELPAQVRELRDFLDVSYATLGSVDEVAAHFYYSREYVTRLFTKYFNLSPWKYVEQLRIRDACARIEAGEKITSVCYAVGYHSMSAFSAAFRRVMGEAPSRSRNASIKL